MKIIRQGKLPEERVYRIECSRCDTLFEFQRKEATFYSDQRDGDRLEIDCPHCGRECLISVDLGYNGPG